MREYYIYSMQEFSSNGQKWLDWCLTPVITRAKNLEEVAQIHGPLEGKKIVQGPLLHGFTLVGPAPTLDKSERNPLTLSEILK